MVGNCNVCVHTVRFWSVIFKKNVTIKARWGWGGGGGGGGGRGAVPVLVN